MNGRLYKNNGDLIFAKKPNKDPLQGPNQPLQASKSTLALTPALLGVLE